MSRNSEVLVLRFPREYEPLFDAMVRHEENALLGFTARQDAHGGDTTYYAALNKVFENVDIEKRSKNVQCVVRFVMKSGDAVAPRHSIRHALRIVEEWHGLRDWMQYADAEYKR